MNSVAWVCSPLVSVILPTWNTRDETLEFLESLVHQSYPKSAIEVIITDNGSADGSQDAIRSWYAAHSHEWWRDRGLVDVADPREDRARPPQLFKSPG